MTALDLFKQFFIKNIFDAGGEVYLVGGSVRDLYLGIAHKDFDLLVTHLSYQKLETCLRPLGSMNPVGKSFGIIKFKPHAKPDLEVDLSLPRVEKSTGIGHRDFEVDFDPGIPVEQDLGRRDFTVNAMAIHLATQNRVDPFGGKKDLESRTLRQVFLEAFSEDPLRLLRAVQFSARFHFTVEPQTLASMKTHAPLILTVSKERIITEIKKLFLAKKPSRGFDLMRETEILPLVFPFVHKMIGVKQPMKKNEDVYQHTMKVLDASRSALEMDKPGNLDLMLAALLHDAGKPKTVGFDKKKDRVTFYGHQLVSKKIARRWLDEYKATCIGANIEKITHLVHEHMFETKAFYSDKAIRRFVNKIGKDHIFDLIDLRIADKKGGRYPDSMKGILNLRSRIKAEIEKKPPFGPKDLAIDGHGIMQLGFNPGPIIGQIQKFLMEKVLDEPALNTKEKLSTLIQENFRSSHEQIANGH